MNKLRLSIVVLLSITALLLQGVSSLAPINGSFLLQPFGLLLSIAFVAIFFFPPIGHQNWSVSTLILITLYLIFIFVIYGLEIIWTPVMLRLIVGQLITLMLIIPLSCWAANKVSQFEEAIYHLGLQEPIADIRELKAENTIQSELMRSRYLEEPVGLIVLENSVTSKKILQNELINELQKQYAQRHWQTQLAKFLRNELRFIDHLYKGPTENQLYVFCPGLAITQLTELSEQIEKKLSQELGAEASCTVASFPDEAVTLDGLINSALEKVRLKSKGEDYQNRYNRSGIDPI